MTALWGADAFAGDSPRLERFPGLGAVAGLEVLRQQRPTAGVVVAVADLEVLRQRLGLGKGTWDLGME